ncbi:MAG: hypothetical protein US45_C0007G0007 [Candidatus Nomurabacteria bacterium GW2011_GWA1_37_20]|uniref:Uncharacterized protein n=2 Tax=Parcubacteria group TaxID=1794811 RepID=A0A0G0KF84_9BACT|nr:MAG: hypothetical protein US33_C0001G0011 [Parcubacteria group bacterium GW2011_GWC1_36_9]KKQ28147.1 MAG: hypothetical protein US41_C0009G0005 [Parcubacteria group bacterium GW2011_GWB1_37_13]KKQ33746.1 MAG: hypothetical protein US45_C0007G0007 [Candidatus Nomurabacteria bacterium GW2011_GWA1_37_20]KKQ47839.1 MAG: hypothetical protein US65_C0003G0008 [Candidatus Yanofskybacteria bacterium GW2011_GWC2_37_9]
MNEGKMGDRGVKKKARQKLEVSVYYDVNNIKELVYPFITEKDPEMEEVLALNISMVLNHTDESMIRDLETGFFMKDSALSGISNIEEAIKAGKISSEAPWWKELEDKLLKFKIFVADLVKEIDYSPKDRVDEMIKVLEKFIEETKDGDKKERAKKILGGIAEARKRIKKGSGLDSDGSENK